MENTNQKKPANKLAIQMGIALICGIVFGLAMLFLRENLNGSGQGSVWNTINNILF